MANPKSVDYSIFPKIDLTFTPLQGQNEIYIQNAYKRVTTKTGISDPPSGQFWSPRTVHKDVPGATAIPLIPDEPCCISEIAWAVPLRASCTAAKMLGQAAAARSVT